MFGFQIQFGYRGLGFQIQGVRVSDTVRVQVGYSVSCETSFKIRVSDTVRVQVRVQGFGVSDTGCSGFRYSSGTGSGTGVPCFRYTSGESKKLTPPEHYK